MAKWHSYPPSRGDGDIYRRSLLQKANSAFRSYRDTRRVKESGPVDVSCAGEFRPLAPADLPAMVVARNEMAMLPSFLSHYRRLGVTRFIFLDDRSDDGSLEYLAAQADVDVWGSSIRYAEAGLGNRWREALFDRYGHGRWYLNLDADEYLIYDGYEQRSLSDLIRTLEERSCLRLSAPMIDMYPLGSVDLADFSGSEKMPWEVASHFDRSGYRLRLRRQNILIQGGPRLRKFGLVNQLIKAPLTFWDEKSSLKKGIHKPLPYTRNFLPISGVLLHFKFFADFRKEVQDAIVDDQHYDNAREYKVLEAALQAGGSLDFQSEISERYLGAGQMIDLGFMEPIWPGEGGRKSRP